MPSTRSEGRSDIPRRQHSWQTFGSENTPLPGIQTAKPRFLDSSTTLALGVRWASSSKESRHRSCERRCPTVAVSAFSACPSCPFVWSQLSITKRPSLAARGLPYRRPQASRKTVVYRTDAGFACDVVAPVRRASRSVSPVICPVRGSISSAEVGALKTRLQQFQRLPAGDDTQTTTDKPARRNAWTWLPCGRQASPGRSRSGH